MVRELKPELAPRVHRFDKGNILEEHGVSAALERALRAKVWLDSGGYIVINQTEALVAVDVNTGRYTGKKNLEDTILKTNLEAVKELVRQIRLRDLGGIIVVDFIDMEERKSLQKVMAALEQELSRDRSPSKLISVNEFGLVILTRKRVKQSLERILCQPCPYCVGSGMIKSVATVCSEIYDEVKKLASDMRGQPLLLRVNPEVARALSAEGRRSRPTCAPAAASSTSSRRATSASPADGTRPGCRWPRCWWAWTAPSRRPATSPRSRSAGGGWRSWPRPDRVPSSARRRRRSECP